MLPSKDFWLGPSTLFSTTVVECEICIICTCEMDMDTATIEMKKQSLAKQISNLTVRILSEEQELADDKAVLARLRSELSGLSTTSPLAGVTASAANNEA